MSAGGRWTTLGEVLPALQVAVKEPAGYIPSAGVQTPDARAGGRQSDVDRRVITRPAVNEVIYTSVE